ncbi:MAG: tetratricopeptide repeat protein [Verrucomicrobia bacterium]|nr:tetratricopeptide repeat protein [Verrucomicrobiota bacterium]
MVFLLAFVVPLAGCMPPGPRALLDGRKLLDEGRYVQAVEKLKLATSLLQTKTNAQAWNYLGLACHRAGQPTNAVTAYRQALALNQNLAEARFNLGCLWLEQNRPDLAKEQFTTYTLQRSHTVEGFLKLGAAQFRLREATAAEESYQKALRLSAHNPEALNGLGLVQLQRNRPREAAQHFSQALEQHPNYRPALLNLATVSHRYLNDVPGALQKYRAYLELKPRAADWDAVYATAQSLEQRLSPPQRPAANVAAPQVVATTNAPKPQITHSPVTVKTNPMPTIVKTSPAPPVATTVVKLPAEPVIKTVPDVSPQPAPAGPTLTTSAPPVVAAAPPPAKRSFFQRLNPFHRAPTAKSKVTPLPVSAIEPSPAIPSPKPGVPPAAAATPSARYTYLSPPAPAAGDRAAAGRAFAQAAQFQRANRLNEAAAAYEQAVQLDASYFEAHYNIGLVAYETRNYQQSLAAWENALAVRPDSTDARYNFALALKLANYARDAASELEKVLATNPNETRAHLVLGNLYAEPLHDPAKARAHYLKVLELDPRHSQSTAIRYWLVANPP